MDLGELRRESTGRRLTKRTRLLWTEKTRSESRFNILRNLKRPESVPTYQAPFTDRGCLSCPEGSAFSSDDVLGVAETLTKKILSDERENQVTNYPMNALSTLPTKLNMAAEMDRFTKRTQVNFPDLYRQKWYDAQPTNELETVSKEVQTDAGLQTLDYSRYAGGSLFCNPPIGPRAVAGQDIGRHVSRAAPLTIGPYCTQGQFRSLDGLVDHLEALAQAVPESLKVMEGAEKLKQFITTSKYNASATSGSYKPNWYEGAFQQYPDAPPSLEWLIHSAEQVGQRYPAGKEVRVYLSHQTLDYAIRSFVAAETTDISIILGDHVAKGRDRINGIMDNEFRVVGKRTGRVIVFDTRYPLYVLVRQKGPQQFAWGEQEAVTPRVGDDDRPGETPGIMFDPNQNWGDPNVKYADGAELAEIILMHADNAFWYEAPPVNPFAAKFGDGNILPNIGATSEIMWHFGEAVDIHYLSKMENPADGSCPNNRLNQWFAGEAWSRFIMQEDNLRAMAALMVAVPRESTPLVTNGALPEANSTGTIELTSSAYVEPDLCGDKPAAATNPTGCIAPSPVGVFDADAEDDLTVKIPVYRVGGSKGAITVDYTFHDDDALDGTHYDGTAGTLSFAEGEIYKEASVTIKADSSDPTVKRHAFIRWSSEDLCYDGAASGDTYTEADAVKTDLYITSAPVAGSNLPDHSS